MAKKSKGFGELLRQQQSERTHQQSMKALERKVQQGPLGKKFGGIVTDPSGEVKMSEVLEEFVEPYLDFVKTNAERKKLFELAVIAWNLAIMPASERQPLIDRLLDEAVRRNDPLARQDTQQIIDELIERKHKLFANNNRYIIEFNLQDAGKTFHLSVASTLSEQPTSKS